MTVATLAPRVRAKLTNGASAEVWDLPNIVGVEVGFNEPRTVAEADGIFYLLTDCCGASAKGSSDADGIPYLICRNCHLETWGDEGAPVPEGGFIPLLPNGLWRW